MAVGEVIRESDGTWTFHSICPLCKEPSRVTGLRKRALDRWDMGKGEFVQIAFPELSADQREILLSGTHGACWDKAFPDLDKCLACTADYGPCTCLWFCGNIVCTGDPDPF